jgi:hypothetical protein
VVDSEVDVIDIGISLGQDELVLMLLSRMLVTTVTSRIRLGFLILRSESIVQA